METVRVARNIKITDIAKHNVSAMQMNILIALFTRGGQLTIGNLVQTIRTSNSGYKFVDDNNFYKAVAVLHSKQLVVYG